MPGGNLGAGLAPPATRAPNPGAASDAPTDHGAKVGAARAGIFEGELSVYRLLADRAQRSPQL